MCCVAAAAPPSNFNPAAAPIAATAAHLAGWYLRSQCSTSFHTAGPARRHPSALLAKGEGAHAQRLCAATTRPGGSSCGCTRGSLRPPMHLRIFSPYNTPLLLATTEHVALTCPCGHGLDNCGRARMGSAQLCHKVRSSCPLLCLQGKIVYMHHCRFKQNHHPLHLDGITSSRHSHHLNGSSAV